MISSVNVTFGDRTYPVAFPHSAFMETVVQGIFQSNEYPVLPFLQSRARTVVDVGANVGCTSLIFALHYPDARILAFEPSPHTFEFLQRNVQPFSNVETFPVGLFDRDARVRLYSGAEASVTNSIGDSVFNGSGFEEIQLRRVSEVLDEQGVDRIDLLKIDTEGAEIAILRDLEYRLDRIDVIIFEYHAEEDRRELDQLLSRRFDLYSGTAHHPHRGTLVYVARDLLTELTEWHRYRIARPRV